ncbi:hypothetical protein DQ04_17751010, partial [Trypanosoma grayi]|uniref:hypothetical protein n=1 Tax=Trypanosoma grayi TaxID=71804 RepID=UPI0004F4B969
MRYSCHHGSPWAGRDGAAVVVATAGATCSTTILALERANASLTRDLEQCLEILRDARAYTDEVERVLAAVPAFALALQRHLQGMMLLQHGVFLENAAAQFRVWRNDREALLAAFEEEAQDAYVAYRCQVDDLVEQHENEVEEVHSEWRRTLEEMQAEAARLTQRISSVDEDAKEREARYALLKKAAGVIEQKRGSGGGRSRATQVMPVSVAVGCQTADVYMRTIAVQTMDDDLEQQQQEQRARSIPTSPLLPSEPETIENIQQHKQVVVEEENEPEPEPFSEVPVAFPGETPQESSVLRVALEQRKLDEMELRRLRLELQQLQEECTQEREAALTARVKCSVLESMLRKQSQEV